MLNCTKKQKMVFLELSTIQDNSQLWYNDTKLTYAEANQECERNNGSIAAIVSKNRKSTLIALLVANRIDVSILREEKVWIKVLTRKDDQNSSVFLFPYLFAVRFKSRSITSNHSDALIGFQNASLDEKHAFVCARGNFFQLFLT